MQIKLVLAICFLTLGTLKAQIINTVVGGLVNTVGYSGDGGPATAAQLDEPGALTLDAAGNLYIADLAFMAVRKVDTNGIITTIAGLVTTPPGFSGDGGPATAAQLYLPNGVAVDAAGNVYISEAGNDRIRKINTAGIISTITGNGTWAYTGDGGPATAAEINNPDGIAVDAAGNLYISDGDNDVIRKINTSGIITTVIGRGFFGFSGDGGQATAAFLNQPSGIAVDAGGNIFFSDYYNNRIRKVNTAGIITTVVGNGSQGFGGDGGQATTARIYAPGGIAIDAIGNLYFTDAGNNRIRMVNTAGIITTIVGNGTAGFSGDGGPAIAAKLQGLFGIAVDANSCNLYLSDSQSNRVRKVTPLLPNILNVTVNSAAVCIGNQVSLSASGATTYSWSPSNGLNSTTGSTVIFNDSISNTYTVTGTTKACSNSAIATVTVNPLPVVTVNSLTICPDDNGTLTASGANSYTWSSGANSSSIITNSTTTTYTVVGSNANGCISQPAIISIAIAPKPTVTISGNTTICINQNTTLIASGATTYNWNTGDTISNVTYSPLTTTSYSVVGMLGICKSDMVNTTVTVNNPFNFILPNIVTPNNDEINDFIDFGKFQFSSLQLQIYNQWGAKVFESSDPACIWKPTENDGTYFYTAQYIISCNNQSQNKTLKGFITIIR